MTLFSIGWCEPSKPHGPNQTSGLTFREQQPRTLSRSKRQSQGGFFMRVISMVAILAGLASGGVAMAGGGALAGTAGIMAADRADDDFANSALNECGEPEFLTITTTESICDNFDFATSCPATLCTCGGAGIGGGLGGGATADCCGAAATKVCCFCGCLG